MQPIGWKVRGDLFGLLLRKQDSAHVGKKPRVVEWSERDDWICLCVKMGLNVREIVELSYSWPQPITTTQQAYDKLKQLHLERLYKRKDKKRAGSHNQNIIYVFSKLTGQALEYGMRVWGVTRDSCPEGMRFRPDLSLIVNGRSFHVEVQLSKIEGTRWGEKFRNYLRLYESLKKPFRVLILIDKREDVGKLKRTARRMMEDHPNLNLFLFLTLDQFHAERDVTKAKVWNGVWNNQRFALH